MIKKIVTVIISLVISSLALLVASPTVFADSPAFGIQPQPATGQQIKDVNYFDLRLKPNENEDLGIAISNNQKTPATFMLAVASATTTNYGSINYQPAKVKDDASLKYDLKKMLIGNNKLTIPGNSSEIAHFKMKMPSQSFDGELLGGITITKIRNTNETTHNNGIQINNAYAYVVGIRITETDKLIDPDLEVNQIQSGLNNYLPVILVNIQNKAAITAAYVSVKALVHPRNSTTILHKADKANMQMAPNSNFNFPISWGSQAIEPGQYTMELIISDNNGKTNHHLFRQFSITAAKAATTNKKSDLLSTNNHNQDLLIVVIVIMIAVILALTTVLFVFIHRVKNKK